MFVGEIVVGQALAGFDVVAFLDTDVTLGRRVVLDGLWISFLHGGGCFRLRHGARGGLSVWWWYLLGPS